MKETGLLAAVLVVLLVAVATGAKRWRFDGQPAPSAAGRTAIIVTTLGSLLGVPFWWLDVDVGFAWDLPPVGARLLAASALAFGLTGLACLEWPSARRSRLYLVMIATGFGSVFATTLLFHLQAFDFGAVSSWMFLLIVGVLPALASVELARSFATHPSLRYVRFDNPLIPLWLVLVGITMLAWSLALFIAPDTIFPAVFLWPDDARTSRLVASMLLAIGVAALMAMNDTASGRLALLFAGVYGGGVTCAACLRGVTAFSPPLLYLVVIGGIGLVSLAFLAMLTSSQKRPGLYRRV